MSDNNNIDHNTIDQLNISKSLLSVKSSGIDVQNDLNLPEGKTIAELIYDQEENRPNQ